MRDLPLAFWQLAALATILLLPAPAHAGSDCLPGWIPTFGGHSGTDGSVLAQVVYDDGSGPALYVGGAFESAGGAYGSVARWDGTTWSGVGDLTTYVQALVVHDDGSGTALYAATTEGDVLRWSGGSWSVVGGGPALGDVWCFAVHDDGGGPELYAGGSFLTIDGVAAARVARWDGTSWSALGGGTNYDVYALASYDDGSGPGLYAAGRYSSSGGASAAIIRRWDGSGWSTVGGGLTPAQSSQVDALVVHDDGSGPSLFAGGSFTGAGGNPVVGVARWDGATWSAVGSGPERIRSFAVYDDGTGPMLYAGRSASTLEGVARWDGVAWATVPGLINSVLSIVVYDPGGGPKLYAGGSVWSIPTQTTGPTFLTIAHNIASWDGASWSRLGDGAVAHMSVSVNALASFDVGGSPALFGGLSGRLVRWDGSAWGEIDLPGSFGIGVLTTYDDGSGALLVMGSSSGGSIKAWDGASWVSMGSLGGPSVRALVPWDDGSGPALYAGGRFSSSSSGPVNNVARWDGSSWSALGSGTSGGVRALCTHDDGGGTALYVGGNFATAGGLTVNGVARWDGTSWAALGTGVSGPQVSVRALAVFDDGGGDDLYAGGTFTGAGGVQASKIARWDGSAWSALGGGLPEPGYVQALLAFDDGSGPALFVGGSFTEAGGVAANRIARWDGTSWSPLGGGLEGLVFDGLANDAAVSALAVHDDGTGAALYVGGPFTSAVDSGDSYVAKWGCPRATAFCFGDGACPCGNAGAPGRGCDNVQGTGGVELELFGMRTAPNGATMVGTGFPVSTAPFAVVLRSSVSEPVPVRIGDGLRCVTTRSLVRLAAASASAGTSTHAFGHDAMAGAGDFVYQLWYRNTPSTFCDPFAAFNFSNGLSITWP